ncbi:acetylornithine/succinylornithine family transaminase [Candidatus Poribacteria bacterium]|nr:acetylornithine/succinylornithine family transaminase [Candidatus Poribacteria bacterium]
MLEVLTRNEELAARAARCLMPNYGERNLAIVRGKGCRCWDADGTGYLDFLGGIAVNNLGHNHPAVVRAIKKQAGELVHCSNAYLIERQIELAELLCNQTGLDKAFFCNSGAEATEGSIKLARLWSRNTRGPGKHTILCFEGSFHGRTYGAMSATWSKKVRTGFEPLAPGFVFAKLNDLASVDAVWDDTVCAVLVETIQGEGGVTPCEGDFLRGLRERCTARNALLIADEVQCGMGRSGRVMAYEHAGIEPDIVPIAKAVGGGLPLGGILARGHIAGHFSKGTHGSTFGGNPIACAAGAAACKVLFKPAFLKGVGKKGCKLWGVLEGIQRAYPDLVQGVRGAGLMLGLVLKVPGADLVTIGRRHGMLFNCTADTVLRFLPPLIVSDAEIAEAGEKLAATFAEFASKTTA